MIKSPRNKTISTSIEDGKKYLDRCLFFNNSKLELSQILNKTICGDCFEIIPYIFPKQSIDLIIVDPPYNLTKKFNTETFYKKSFSEYEEYARYWLSLCSDLLKPNGSIYICSDWKTSMVLGKILFDFFIVRNRITWQREKGRGAKTNYKNCLEDIWFCTKSENYTFNLDAIKLRRKVIAPYKINGKPKDWMETSEGNFRDTCPSNFWSDITIPFWSMPENTNHPTQKPEKLIAKLILASSNPNDIIFDPFLGSGTTSVVAKKLGRHFLGIEKNQQYCIWTEQRLENAETNKTIQGYENGIFYLKS